MVAVPTMRSFFGRPALLSNVTVSPTRLWSWAMVAPPSTISFVVSSPWPESNGGATGEPGFSVMVPTRRPSSSALAKLTPDQASTSGSLFKSPAI